MDQIGAMIGSIIVAAVLAWKGSYEYGFAVLDVPALLALAVLAVARINYPQPHDLEPSFRAREASRLRSTFWFYLIAVAFIALGFADYSLAPFHMKTEGIVADKWIPLIYGGAMGVDALNALAFGRLYDKKGFPVLLVMIAASEKSALVVSQKIVGQAADALLHQPVDHPLSIFLGVCISGQELDHQVQTLSRALSPDADGFVARVADTVAERVFDHVSELHSHSSAMRVCSVRSSASIRSNRSLFPAL